MKQFVKEHPDALKAVEQLKFAGPWLATYNTVAVRKALDDEMQAVLSGRKDAAQAVKDAQKNANEILKPFTERITKPIGS
jgi:sn-glycerol 3-phosphate transport system substrate-binding protein